MLVSAYPDTSEISILSTVTLEFPPGVGPHNGRPGYRTTQKARDPAGVWLDDEGGYEVEDLGGQELLIRLAMKYDRLAAPVGRRFGKTTVIPWLVMREAPYITGKYYCVISSPSHDKAYELLSFCQDFWTDKLITEKRGGPKDQLRYLELPGFAQPAGTTSNTACRIYFVSASLGTFERLRGYPHPVHRYIGDEFAQCHPSARNTFNPMLADHAGKALYIGTTNVDEPGNSLFREYAERGKSKEKKWKDWGYMNFPSHANPLLSDKGLENLVKDCLTPDDYKQEVEAQFLEGAGAVFTNLDNVLVLGYQETRPQWVHDIEALALEEMPESLEVSDLQPPDVWVHADYNPLHTYYLSADWAKSMDHTIIRVMDVTTLREACLIRFHGTNWTQQFVWLREVVAHYNVQHVDGDENTGAGEGMHEQLRYTYQQGITGHRFSGHTKGSYVRRVQILFHRASIKLINCLPQRKEFTDYRRIMPDGSKGQTMVRYAHPDGGHDDFVDTLLQMGERLQHGKIAAKPEHKVKGYHFIDEQGRFDMAAVDDYWEDDMRRDD